MAQKIKHAKQKKDQKEIGNDNFSTSLFIKYLCAKVI